MDHHHHHQDRSAVVGVMAVAVVLDKLDVYQNQQILPTRLESSGEKMQLLVVVVVVVETVVKVADVD